MSNQSTDDNYLTSTLADLIAIPSPSGYTDGVVLHVCQILKDLNIHFELTRRGAIRATLKGENSSPSRSIVAHLDTLGAMVRKLKPNGRLAISPIGTWSSRFAEGARVTILTDNEPIRGTVLPLKASGHTYNKEIDTQPVTWDQIEIRVDEKCETQEELIKTGINIGDFISFDPGFEMTQNGFINSRHLDNKAGVASLLAAIHSIKNSNKKPPIDCHFLFTISEEVGSGASVVLHGDVSEMVSIDNSTVAPGQNSNRLGVTIAMKDSTGPFDYHLTRKLIKLCEVNKINYTRDVFRWYRCDAASAIEAGNDIRTALICFACDGSHGYERTHIDSLRELSELLVQYIHSKPTFKRDQHSLSSETKNFTDQPLIKDPSVNPKTSIRPSEYDEE
ncbi:MAG: osmoprotectant NAGGN system M42 family peptidase [Halobacteriovoraceae bacterium]|nr:osmoprotectant NAGGN system M42 family peptidase [Halobacteriovoraceae bacterium]MCB9095265.1 osmoprotectant NAGGN system M42 family peptidase [Halobacteriovoraceae bacterium]